MANTIYFVKMHGLGNDFVIVNKEELSTAVDLNKLAIQISDRSTGIGCDQFIVYNRNRYSSDYQMYIFNCDGSLAKACGNASRCIAKLLCKQNQVKHITLKIEERTINAQLQENDEISVNMGKVSFSEDWMPPRENIWQLAQKFNINPKELLCADIGNPHLIIFSNLAQNDKKLLGQKLQEDALFPDGVNVNFASIIDGNIVLSVWERGAGFTKACGSGACVSFAAAHKLGFVNSNAEVIFPLGKLKMTKLNEEIIMQGAATKIAEGLYYYD